MFLIYSLKMPNMSSAIYSKPNFILFIFLQHWDQTQSVRHECQDSALNNIPGHPYASLTNLGRESVVGSSYQNLAVKTI